MNKYFLTPVFFILAIGSCLSEHPLDLSRDEKEITNGLDDIIRAKTTKILRGDKPVYTRIVHYADDLQQIASVIECVLIKGTRLYIRSVRDGVSYVNIESVDNLIISQEDIDENQVPRNLVIWSKTDGLIEYFERSSSGYLEPVSGKKLIDYRQQWGNMASWVPYMKDETEAEQDR